MRVCVDKPAERKATQQEEWEGVTGDWRPETGDWRLE